MIPSPNLDDRSFEDLVEEAIRLIPQYCPEWTNFNKSDPGITLLELFAWMTEMLIFRLNRVPEKNYLAFLNLLGIQLQPPQPARALVQFSISDKVDSMRIAAGTRLATNPSDDQPALDFETDGQWRINEDVDVRGGCRHIVLDVDGGATTRAFDADVDVQGFFVTAGIRF